MWNHWELVPPARSFMVRLYVYHRIISYAFEFVDVGLRRNIVSFPILRSHCVMIRSDSQNRVVLRDIVSTIVVWCCASYSTGCSGPWLSVPHRNVQYCTIYSAVVHRNTPSWYYDNLVSVYSVNKIHLYSTHKGVYRIYDPEQ